MGEDGRTGEGGPPRDSRRDAPGVVAPPPLIFLAGLAVGFGLDALAPTAMLPQGLQYGLGALMIAIALALAAAALWALRRAGTNVDPRKPATALVTSGPFARTRNPLYLAAALLYGGVAVMADNLWALVCLAVVLAALEVGVVAREERYLEAKFGEPYRAYKKKVRRWM